MNTPVSGPPSSLTQANSLPFRDLITDAIRYWELRRVWYNLVLAAIVLGWVAVTWPHFRGAFTWPPLFAIFVFYWIADEIYPSVP
jgi:hypothetical protein